MKAILKMRHDDSNVGGVRIDTTGYIIEVSGRNPLKKTVRSFSDVKKVLQDRKLDGSVKIFRSWDQFQLFSGEIADVRQKIGVRDNQKPLGRRWAKLFGR